ncbi:MAG: lamin tail domain-containing protein, partial [Sedimentisphaerales bacterium]|nr:lamin tail domain-containing protein [Sedimentisphaerales bacterium]
MHKSANLYFFSLALSLSVACSAGAFCLKGDLNGNCEVNFEDVLSLASEWLGPAGSDGDLVGNDGVNSADFAELAKNWGKSRSKVIINEIHYDPDVKTELVEYVELHNRSEVDVNIGDWYFSSGISYQFPAGTILVAGDYVVAAQTPTLVCSKYGVSAGKVFGPWVGKLSNEGEEVVLRDSDGAKVDAVDYKLGFPWPTVGCPPGDSIELVNPLFDNDLGGNWRPSEPDTISPPRVIIESQSTWRYFKGYSEASEPNHAAWREIGFDDSSWDQGDLVIGYGEGGGFLTTVLDDMRYNYSSVYLRKTFEIDDPGAIGNLVLEAIYDDGFNVYINNKHVRNVNMQNDEMPYDGTARSALEDLNWNTFNLPPASEYLVAGTNVIAVHLHNASLRDSSDCFLDVRLKETFSSTSAGPTPGRQNTAYSENDAPQIRQVDHEPSQPRSGEDVKITAKVTDNDGVEYVMLFYQRVDAGSYIELSDPAYETNWSMAEMHDDGLAGDETAGDDIYTAVLSGSNQVHRRLVRYRISVWDYTGVSTEAPYRYDYESEPVPNFAYFVYDGVPSWFGSARPGYTPVVEYGPEVLTHVPVYHLISKKQSVVDAMHIPNSTAGEYWGDSYPWYGTLVYDGKVYDHIRYRARGGCWRYSMGKNMWKFDFNRAESFQARDDYGEKYDTKWRKLNFSACIQQGDTGYRGEQGMLEAAGFKLFNLAGVEAPKTHWVH